MLRFIKLSFCLLLLMGSAAYADLPRLKGTFLIEHETFLLWYAKQQGWDKELGFELELGIADTSGTDIMQSRLQDPKAWQICAIGAVPAALYSDNLRLDIVGIANDKSKSIDILVRSDSPILQQKSWNLEYPEAKGSPETIRDKTFYLRKDTTSFYTFLRWLDLFGLNLNDVSIVDVTPEVALAEFSEHNVDGAVMWSPHSLKAIHHGYSIAAKAEDVGIFTPVLFITDREFASQNEDLIARFLSMYLKAVNVQLNDLHSLIEPYQEFLFNYTGQAYNKKFCKIDLEKHQVYSYASQLKLFSPKVAHTSPILKLKHQILSKFTLISLELGEPKNYMTLSYDLNPTDRYLKLARQYLKE